MLESFNVNNEMEYQKLFLEEQQQRGILGRLVGIIADFKNPTRNGRRYTEELWDKTFNNPIMKEKLENRCLFGELGHPVDRQEVDMEKVAICLAEPPKKGTDGKLYGVFDILATPNGRILKTFCDYGCKIGVSSRGSGDTVEDYDGNETVEPDTYECECWDAVLLPAVKTARVTYVNESFAPQKTLKVALQEALNNSTDNERKTMTETLDSLNIDYGNEEPADDVTTPEKVDNIDNVTTETPQAAEDSGAEVVHELQEALKTQRESEKQIKSLHEKLSVCYTKEARYSEILERTKAQLAKSRSQNELLNEQISAIKTELNESITQNDKQLQIAEKLTAQLNESDLMCHSLDEKLKVRYAQIKSLQEQLTNITNTHKNEIAELEAENKKLTESIEESKKDTQIFRSQAVAKVEKSQKLVEKYKSIAKTAIDKYISLQATRLGIDADEIKNKLNENYSFNDIDTVCEGLQSYKLTVNSLPFGLTTKQQPVKMTIKESKERIVPSNNSRVDDEIDGTLINFIT